jgi:hypothetical protein
MTCEVSCGIGCPGHTWVRSYMTGCLEVHGNVYAMVPDVGFIGLSTRCRPGLVRMVATSGGYRRTSTCRKRLDNLIVLINRNLTADCCRAYRPCSRCFAPAGRRVPMVGAGPSTIEALLCKKKLTSHYHQEHHNHVYSERKPDR